MFIFLDEHIKETGPGRVRFRVKLAYTDTIKTFDDYVGLIGDLGDIVCAWLEDEDYQNACINVMSHGWDEKGNMNVWGWASYDNDLSAELLSNIDLPAAVIKYDHGQKDSS